MHNSDGISCSGYNYLLFTIHPVLLLQMSQATLVVNEDAGSVSVCAEVATLPFQRTATVQFFTTSMSATGSYKLILMNTCLKFNIFIIQMD